MSDLSLTQKVIFDKAIKAGDPQKYLRTLYNSGISPADLAIVSQALREESEKKSEKQSTA